MLILPFLHSKDPSDQRAEEKRGRVPHLENTIEIIVTSVTHGLTAAVSTASNPRSSTCFRVVIIKTENSEVNRLLLVINKKPRVSPRDTWQQICFT